MPTPTTTPALTLSARADAAFFARCSLRRRPRPEVLRALVRVYGPEYTAALSAVVQEESRALREQRVVSLDERRWSAAMASSRRSIATLRGLGRTGGAA